METSFIKYYKIIIANPLIEDSISENVFAVKSNDEYRELFTGKKIYILGNNMLNDVFLDDFSNKNCNLIGIEKESCDESEVARSLRFSLPARKDEIIENIAIIEESINRSIVKSKIKVLKNG